MLGFASKIAHIGIFNLFIVWPPLMGYHLSTLEDLVL